MQPRFQTATFQTEVTLYHIKPNIYIKKNKFFSHKQYLFSLSSSRNGKKTHTDKNILHDFLLCPKRNDSETFSPVFMLLVQLATLNVFYFV